MQGHRRTIRRDIEIFSSPLACLLALAVASLPLATSGALPIGEEPVVDGCSRVANPATRSGFDGTVWCLLEYDDMLIAGGDFSMVGGVPASGIACWDGAAWSPLGSGMNGIVYCLGVFDGDLIAGGEFTYAGGVPAARIARWNGTAWFSLGSGANAGVRALLEYQGSLVAGGDFTVAGGVGASKIALWNGSQWSPLGQGFSGGYNSLGVRALAIYDGQIAAGGFFTHSGSTYANRVARWDGQAWQRLGAWTNDTIYTLLTYRDHLIAGSTVWNAGAGTWANLIRHWDGMTWSPMGGGNLDPPFPNAVRALAVYDGRVYVGGQFPRADGTVVNYIAEWNGRQWRPVHWFPVGSGMNGPVYALASYGGSLFAGGEFTTAGGNPAERIAAWDHITWSEPDRGPVAVRHRTVDGEVVLTAYPNPFDDMMTVQFSLDGTATVSFDVYDLCGRWLVRLASGSFASGVCSITWNGVDARGVALAPGVYIYRLAVNGVPRLGQLLKGP